MYKQFDREGHTDIISDDLKTHFHIYQLYGHDTWRIEVIKHVGTEEKEISQKFIGFKTPEKAIEFVTELVRPELVTLVQKR